MASLRGSVPVEGESAGSAEDDGGGAQAAPASAPSVAEVRAWARTNGFEVADAGPIPKDVQAAYDAANTG